jgi:anti-sigma factor ChrR (cupin superfamily)
MKGVEPQVIRDLFQHVRQPDLAWAPFQPGVEIHRVYGDEKSGPSAILLRYAPGASIPFHTHSCHEHIFVLDGEQADQRGTYRAGDFVVNPPGSAHSVTSASGCVVLVVRHEPVAFTAR